MGISSKIFNNKGMSDKELDIILVRRQQVINAVMSNVANDLIKRSVPKVTLECIITHIERQRK